jgi:hypothetical protein
MRTRASCCAGTLSTLLFVAAARAQTGGTVAGHWQGMAQIPGAPAVIVLDLDQAAGTWVGSATAPGYGQKGVPLTTVAVSGNGEVQASVALFGGAKLRAHLAGDRLTGTLEAGGNTAPLALARAGIPQVDLPPRNTALAVGFEGQWKAEFEAGSKLHAELFLRNEPGGTSSGEITVAETGNAPQKLDRIVQEGAFLRFRVNGPGVEFDGRLNPAGTAIEGRMYMAALDWEVVWQRAATATPTHQESKK